MVISLSPFIFIFCLFPSFLYGIKKYSSYLLFIFSYFCINLLSKISLWKFVKLHNVISTERKKWEVSEQTYPNDYLPRFSQKKKSQLKWQSSRSLFSTCWNGWISYTEPKWLFCLQFTESQDSSSHLGATELWQSVIFELFSLCTEEESSDAAFCLWQELFELFTMNGRTAGGRGWRGWCNSIDIDPAGKKSKLTCNTNGSVANVKGRPFSNVTFTS